MRDWRVMMTLSTISSKPSIDELGYLSLTKQTARIFFQLVSKRYEKGSIIVTSNKPFGQWGEIYNDEVVASAILDRLLHHAYPFLISGKSFQGCLPHTQVRFKSIREIRTMSGR